MAVPVGESSFADGMVPTEAGDGIALNARQNGPALEIGVTVETVTS